MKQLLFIAFAATLFTACNNGSKTKDTTSSNDSMNMTSNDGKAMDTTKNNTANEITDPVCGMTKDSTWTDYTIYKGDTVWFCSASEKDVFNANPEKFADKLHKH